MFVLEVNALIDFVEAEPSVIKLSVSHLGPVHIPAIVLHQIRNRNDIDCKRLRITLAECTIEQILKASQCQSGLSFGDRISLILARDRNWTCITNDPVVRGACIQNGINTLCGLDMIVELFQFLYLSRQKAIRAARALYSANPRHVNKESVVQCEQRIENLSRTHLRKRIP